MIPEVTCPACGTDTAEVHWMPAIPESPYGPRRMIRLGCSWCGRYIDHVPPTFDLTAAADLAGEWAPKVTPQMMGAGRLPPPGVVEKSSSLPGNATRA